MNLYSLFIEFSENREMHDHAIEFVDQLGVFFESLGLDRASGRVLGYLFLQTPEERGAADMMRDLSLSRGAVSMAVRRLEERQYLSVRGTPGSRKKLYRLQQDGWTLGVTERARAFGRFAEIAGYGATEVPGLSAEAKAQLKETQNFYRFLETRFAQVIDEWFERRGGDL